MSKIEDGQAEKKLKKELLEADAEELDQQVSNFDNLPPEMLMKILKHLDGKTLLACRLVNRKFNGIASDVCRSSPDIEIQFDCSDNKKEKVELPSSDKIQKRSLKDFFRCFGDTKNFPYSRFLVQVQTFTFVDKNWTQLIADFGANIKCLKLIVKRTFENDYLIEMTETLRDQLLTQLPKLEEFGLKSYDSLNEMRMTDVSKIQLFPKYGETSSNSEIVPLPHLKILHLDESSILPYTGIITDILQAAVNLQRIESFSKEQPFYTIEGFLFLQSLGKLHCLQSAQMEPTAELLSKSKSKPNCTSLNFKLKTLDLYMEHVYENKELWSSTTFFMSNLLKCSKDTLNELSMEPLRFLQQFSFPKFSKLIKLNIRERWWEESDPTESIFPVGIKFQELFPVLKSLELDHSWTTAFPRADCVPSIPTLETLHVLSRDVSEESIAQISVMCPNLKNFQISDSGLDGPFDIENFPPIGNAIWTHLKKLESLWLAIQVGNEDNCFPAIDSCITGISRDDCRRLNDLKKADKLLKKCGSQVSLSELAIERQHASILDLKDLKNLTILLVLYNDLGDELDPLLKSELTFISEDYAFKLMKNLTYKIEEETVWL